MRIVSVEVKVVATAPPSNKQPRKRKKRKPPVFTPRTAAELSVALQLDVGELRRFVRWSKKLTYQLMARGLLRTFKVGNRRYATRAAVDECLAALEADSAPQRAAASRKQRPASAAASAA